MDSIKHNQNETRAIPFMYPTFICTVFNLVIHPKYLELNELLKHLFAHVVFDGRHPHWHFTNVDIFAYNVRYPDDSVFGISHEKYFGPIKVTCSTALDQDHKEAEPIATNEDVTETLHS